MAEFSTEWAEMNGFTEIADFSILSIFKKLKEGEINKIICEGFGITAVGKKNNQCLVEYKSSFISYEDFCKIYGKTI